MLLTVLSVLVIACTEGVDESMSTAPVAPDEVQPENSPYDMGEDSVDYQDGMEMDQDSLSK